MFARPNAYAIEIFGERVDDTLVDVVFILRYRCWIVSISPQVINNVKMLDTLMNLFHFLFQ